MSYVRVSGISVCHSNVLSKRYNFGKHYMYNYCKCYDFCILCTKREYAGTPILFYNNARKAITKVSR